MCFLAQSQLCFVQTAATDPEIQAQLQKEEEEARKREESESKSEALEGEEEDWEAGGEDGGLLASGYLLRTLDAIAMIA